VHYVGRNAAILLTMQNDPLAEWQRLTEVYGKMYDGELLELAADSADLTEGARQVLGDEMRKRGLETSGPASNAPERPYFPAPPLMDSAVNMPESDRADSGEDEQESDLPHDYTWKTLLCECDGAEEAWQISEVLRQAGIESWIERQGRGYSVVSEAGMEGNIPVVVAADQLDQARAIAARPIPQEIVEQSKMQTPEFEPPVCPTCGAGDPVLEGVDPVNSWRCEACGKEWSESATALKGEEKA